MQDYLNRPAELAAPLLLGSIIERKIDGHTLRVRIVETEAYDQSDAASHSYKGRTPRTEIMFGPPGFLYVYFTYGMHYCCNIVTDQEGRGSAVLIRAVEPLEGEDYMKALRDKSGKDLSNGPAKLCQALSITKELNGHDLSQGPVTLVLQEPLPADRITQTTRIGISHAQEMPWRFYETGNPYISKSNS